MSKSYFSKLNYTLANEDTGLEVAMVKKLKPKQILTVCGSGGRSLPLLSAKPDKIVISDLSKEQIQLARLRLQCIKELSLDDFLLFWGYPPFNEAHDTEKRKSLFSSLNLLDEDKEFFTNVFLENHWHSLLYLGKWEQTFEKISKIVRLTLGRSYDNIFMCDSISQQSEYYQYKFPKSRWKIILAFIGNAAFFNSLLYKGHFIEKNVKDSHHKYYSKAYFNIFTRLFAKENFFLQLCFFGRIKNKEANTIEVKPDVYSSCKEARNSSEVIFKQEDLIKIASSGDYSFDFVSLSDVPSYFSGDTEKEFLQRMLPSLNSGCVLVLRSYLRVPNVNLEGFSEVTSEYQGLIDQEKTQMYRIQVFRKD